MYCTRVVVIFYSTKPGLWVFLCTRPNLVDFPIMGPVRVGSERHRLIEPLFEIPHCNYFVKLPVGLSGHQDLVSSFPLIETR